jgi:threonine/homoserine/homoserine lactone efflux protein
MDITPLVTIAVLHLAATMSPGPGFVLVTRISATSPRRSALQAAAGTVLGSLIWATAALLGFQVMLAKAAWVYRTLQTAGGLYLAFLGVAMWRLARVPLPVDGASTRSSGLNAFWQALSLALSNPKVVVFFGTVFATAFTPTSPAILRWAALLIVLGNESIWFGSLAMAFGRPPVRRIYARAKASLERFFGLILLSFGGKLLWDGAGPSR